MAKGMAVCIGLNAVDPGHYQGWSGPLTACEFDANDMALLATSQGLTVTKLLTAHATRKAVATAIRNAAKSLVAGDLCMITYSGHGGQIPDLNGDEEDGMDETWCLHDGEQVDDELFDLLARFRKGVRVLILSDSCHSGTVIKNALTDQSAEAALFAARPGRDAGAPAEAPVRYRAMPIAVVQSTYLANKAFYDPILTSDQLASAQSRVEAACLLISGCQDNQLSQDGAFNGKFTGVLKSVWNGGKFRGSYTSLVKTIVRRMPPDQTPNRFAVGGGTAEFSAERPFTL